MFNDHLQYLKFVPVRTAKMRYEKEAPMPSCSKVAPQGNSHWGMQPETEPTNSMLHMVGERSGRKWAEEFCKRNPAIDEGMMLGWFCNAIEAGALDEARQIFARQEEAKAAKAEENRAFKARYKRDPF